MPNRTHPKNGCFRVLLRARSHEKGPWRFRWPIISADEAPEACAIARELYRGEVDVVEAIRLHATEVHVGWRSPRERHYLSD